MIGSSCERVTLPEGVPVQQELHLRYAPVSRERVENTETLCFALHPLLEQTEKSSSSLATGRWRAAYTTSASLSTRVTAWQP